MANAAGIRIAAESNPGLVRKHNEDNFVYLRLPGRRSVLAAVADGVGGHANGGIASLICCRDLARAYRRSCDAELATPGGAEEFLNRTLSAANRRIFERNRLEHQPRPMGSTVVAALFFADQMVVASAGDSRLYELGEDGTLHQLTTDHTFAAEFAREYGYELNFSDDMSNIIARAVGPQRNLELDIFRRPRPARSRYFLCSDGASRYLPDPDLAGILAESRTPRDAVNVIMRRVLLSGGRDNITAMVLFPEEEEMPAGTKQEEHP